MHACLTQWLERNNTCPMCKDSALPLRDEVDDDATPPTPVPEIPETST